MKQIFFFSLTVVYLPYPVPLSSFLAARQEVGPISFQEWRLTWRAYEICILGPFSFPQNPYFRPVAATKATDHGQINLVSRFDLHLSLHLQVLFLCCNFWNVPVLLFSFWRFQYCLFIKMHCFWAGYSCMIGSYHLWTGVSTKVCNCAALLLNRGTLFPLSTSKP